MKSLAEEERGKVRIWAWAMQEFINSDTDQNQDLSFIFEVLNSNKTIPVILLDTDDNIISYRNIDSLLLNTDAKKEKLIQKFKNNNKEYFPINFNDEIEINRVYYSDSVLLS
ncbi:hypothetical protein LJC11_05755, partial [Bacteroidales bacterium OttesenSCG-928-I21]|nr:hypothetical protein [Bacteroidales bacterium OttesenSCG-928-I21]